MLGWAAVIVVLLLVYYYWDYRTAYKKWWKHADLHDRAEQALQQIEDKKQRCSEEDVALLKRAGIYEEVEQVVDGPIRPDFPDAHYGSKQYKSELREIQRYEREYKDYRIRKIYFSVSDIDLRKQLIAKTREFVRLRIEWWRQNVAVAKASGNEAELKDAEKSLAEELEEPFLFSREEGRTGNPDFGNILTGAQPPNFDDGENRR